MKNCPFCDCELIPPLKNEFKQSFSCYGGSDGEHFTDVKDNRYLIEFTKGGVTSFYFSNFMHEQNDVVMLQDINLIKDKTFEEIKIIYNKMRTFK